jgi:acyl-CoA thioesterase-1
MKYLIAAILLVYITACNNESKQTGRNEVKEETADTVQIKRILFFGNSLTAGYGLEDPDEAFPAVIQQKIDSLKLPYKAINAGLSGETTAGGVSRINWLLKQQIDIFVLELGANDGLRGIPVAETKKNLQSFLDTVKTRYPKAKRMLLGMEVPPNMGGKYASEFRLIFREVAEKNNIPFVPFMLEGVAGNAKLNLRDGIHPTGEGYKIVAENVWEVLKGEL